MNVKEYVSIPEERMKLLIADPRIVKKIEEISGAKIKLNDEISISCKDPLVRIRLKEVLKAFGRGFDSETSLNMLDEDYFLEIIHVSEFAGKSKNRQTILKSRIIGTKGRAKKKIEKCCDVKISIRGKTVSIIGRWDGVNLAKESVEKLLSGGKHSSVYRFLEERKTA